MIKRYKGFYSTILILTMLLTTAVGCSDKTELNDKEDVSIQTNKNAVLYNNFKEEYIRSQHIVDIVKVLSSEQYEGRLPGTEGNKLTVDYVANYFKKIGLKSPEGLNDYRQPFKHFVKSTNSAPSLEIIDDKNKVVKKYEYINEFQPITFPGSTLEGENSGKSLVIKKLEDINSDNEELKGKILLFSDKFLKDNGMNNVFSKALSQDLGIKGIIYEVKLKDPMNYFTVAPNANPGVSYNRVGGVLVFRSSSEAFKDILKKSESNKAISMASNISVDEVESENIIGILPGSDDKLKDEYIIICGHMDHVGDNKNGTYNPGALDNASGTASMMEIARILKENNINPKKSIVFIAFNGEEEGLWGSKYYVDNPIFALDKTTVINLDMVGSKSDIPLEIANYSKAESNLRDDLFRFSKDVGIDAVKSVSQGSDHYPFGTKGVEAVLLIHFDKNSGYHSPGDTIESVDESRIKDVVKLVLYYLDKKAF